jgi:hypothetical protein
VLLLGCLWLEVSGLFGSNDKMMLGIEAWGCLVSVILTVKKFVVFNWGCIHDFNLV